MLMFASFLKYDSRLSFTSVKRLRISLEETQSGEAREARLCSPGLSSPLRILPMCGSPAAATLTLMHRLTSYRYAGRALGVELVAQYPRCIGVLS
jgi:hypothetical protein